MSLADYYRGLTAVQARLPREEAATSDLAAAATAATDALDELLAVSPAAGAACRAGCAFCCSFPVGVTLPEALRLAVAVLAHRDADQLTTRIASDAAAVRALPWDQLAAALHPCPLLGADHRCRVYQDRPLPCRAFRSSDRDACERAFAMGGAAPPPANDGAGLVAGQGASAALAGFAASMHLPGEHRELRSALTALILLPASATTAQAAAAFAAARPAGD